MRFRELFGTDKPVIAMLHLKADGNMGMLERAKAETRCYLEHGVDALLVENYFGTAGDCARVLSWLKREHPDVIYGLNVLGDTRRAFELAETNNARFIQIDSVCGHLPPQADEPYAEALNALRMQSGVAVLGGVRFKYQPVYSGRSLEEDLLLGKQRCDAIVVTGDETGKATPIEKMRRFRNVIGSFPLVMGAGMAPDAVEEVFRCCDGAIVGSWFKDGHRDSGNVNPDYVRAFMEKKGEVSGNC